MNTRLRLNTIPARLKKRRRLLTEVVIISAGYFAYFGVRGATAGEDAIARANAEVIVNFERALGLFHEPALQALFLSYDWVLKAANWVYLFGHWPVIIVVGFWLYRKRWVRYQVYRNAIVLSGALALIVFILYPVAPPRLISGVGGDFIDTVTEYTNLYHILQPAWLTNQFAALPSLHFGWNLLVGIALVKEARHPLARIAGILLPLLMFGAIVVTANHYIIDAAAGGAIALVGLIIAGKLNSRKKSKADLAA